MQNTILDSRDPQLAIYYLGIILKWINVDTWCSCNLGYAGGEDREGMKKMMGRKR
ncbi:hypothetical protein K0M31_019011 [Melipona bicolor]|uniref:Uncharacterized protein n=1 Tax=Melipona bicolor TaxID=60889 RepID=A0AA40KDU1_9HYME|nr:hypothetical protein K0M31_019011 [Melipona bicolor]